MPLRPPATSTQRTGTGKTTQKSRKAAISLNGPGSVLDKAENGIFSGSRPDMTGAAALDPDYVQQALIPLASETHSGEDVAIYARGPWAHLFDGTVEQNYVFHVMYFAVHGE